MDKHKWACIVNPVAGNGYALKNLDRITSRMKSIDHRAPVYLTEKPGHGTIIAENLLEEGYDTILVAGGDGTAHEVGSVLVDYNDAAMGIISAGTGNDYNYMAGFPDRFEDEHWKNIKNRHITRFDVGVCNDQFFFNGMGIGFDATMSAESQADRERTGKSGKGRYTWIILRTLLGYKEIERSMSIDNKKLKHKSFLTTIAIGRRFAGTYYLTPDAVADDGLLDICDIDPLSLYQRLNILLKVPKGTHLGNPQVSYYNCKSCALQFDEVVPAHLDGELIFEKNFDISIKEKCLNLITNL